MVIDMKKMAFIDMEGVLIPEIWKHFANILNIPELSITTREVPNYKQLMSHRINILKDKNIALNTLVEMIHEVEVFNGAKDFLNFLQTDNQFEIKIISNCFHEFLDPFFEKLNFPVQNTYCHTLRVGENGLIENVNYSRDKGKHEIIVKYQKEKVSLKNSIAIGDAFNDFTMLHLVDHGFLFKASEEVKKNSPFYFHKVQSYQDILNYLNSRKIIEF